MKFEKVNLNPSGRKTADCVVRALVKATHTNWSKVYYRLCEIGGNKFAMPNEKRVYEIYLEENGFKKQKMLRFSDNSRYTVIEFADANPKGTFVIGVAKHLTVIIDGTLYDTWNCGHKSVGNYWTK